MTASTRRNDGSSTSGSAPESPTPQVLITSVEMPRSTRAWRMASARCWLRTWFDSRSPWPSACPTSCTYFPLSRMVVARRSTTMIALVVKVDSPVGNRVSVSSLVEHLPPPSSVHSRAANVGAVIGISERVHRSGISSSCEEQDVAARVSMTTAVVTAVKRSPLDRDNRSALIILLLSSLLLRASPV